jgi:hypothetical protein
MTDRRSFLKAGSAILMPSPHRETLQQARDLVREGKLGFIGFCRIAHDDLRSTAEFVLSGHPADCVIGVEPEADGATFLGSYATLTVSNIGWRVFPPTP